MLRLEEIYGLPPWTLAIRIIIRALLSFALALVWVLAMRGWEADALATALKVGLGFTLGWSAWISFINNGKYSHLRSRWTQQQIREAAGEADFAAIVAGMKAQYPNLAADIDGGPATAERSGAGCDIIIDATIYPCVDRHGVPLKNGVGLRPIGYQVLKRRRRIDFAHVDAKAFLLWALERCGARYWWGGLIRLSIPKVFRPPPPADILTDDRFYCNEYIFVGALAIGTPILHKNLSPADSVPAYVEVVTEGLQGPELIGAAANDWSQ